MPNNSSVGSSVGVSSARTQQGGAGGGLSHWEKTHRSAIGPQAKWKSSLKLEVDFAWIFFGLGTEDEVSSTCGGFSARPTAACTPSCSTMKCFLLEQAAGAGRA